MTTRDGLDHETTCLMCAVRALTEGDPAATWNPTDPGTMIAGVVLRQGTVTNQFGQIPFVDLWLGGTSRVRVMAYSEILRHALMSAAAQIGDRLQVQMDEPGTIENGRFKGRPYKRFSVTVQRGH